MLKSLEYAAEFEILGYRCPLPDFESLDKLELVKGMWKTHRDRPQALILIARICVEFSIQEQNIWTLLLKRMTKLFMVSTHCLLQTSHIVHLLCHFIK
jgi:hypothetical protein